MSDKLQFVVAFGSGRMAETSDKLKFVGHFQRLFAMLPSLPAVSEMLEPSEFDRSRPSHFAALTYDSARKRVVLFGGNRALFGKTEEEIKLLGDTWEWDGKKWLEIKAPGPLQRAEAAMTFDRKCGRVLLFGGYNRNGQKLNRLGDTWEWDGMQWVENRLVVAVEICGKSRRACR